MTAVTDISSIAHIDCPSALRDLPGWVIWRFEDNPGKKPRKVPYYVAGGRRLGQQGTPSDRQQLVTFDQARAAAARRGFDGVGFAPLDDFGIVALDFDNCVKGKTIHPEVMALLADTYAEFSPSGKGIRAFFKGALGNRKSHGEPFGFETFSSKGFVTFTGNVLDIVDAMGNADEVAPVSQPVLDLVQRRFKRELETPQAVDTEPVGLSPNQIARALEVLSPDLAHDDWLHVGMALHHETKGEGFQLWDTWSSAGTEYPGAEELLHRWNTFGRNDGPAVTARSLVHMANEHGAGIALNGPASAEEFEAIGDQPQDPTKPMRFEVQPIGTFAGRAPPEWIVKGVLPRAELVVLFGESGSGKSFMALDIAGAISRGIEWRGCRVKQGRVVYVAAEGAGGFRNRVQAYGMQHQLDLATLDMGVIHAAPNFLEKADALDVCKAIKASGGAQVVIVDTFAQVTPGGNENSGEDVGKALAHCKGIHRSTGAVVILIHHSGKDASKGARGWSGLRAAADAELEVVRTPTGRMLRISKQKDGDDDKAWGFGLDVVNIGMDSDGDVITSCVVVEAALPVGGTKLKPLGAVEVVVNLVIQEMAEAQTSGIEVDAVLKEAAKRMDPPTDGKRDTRRQRALRALKVLTEGDDAPYFLEDNCISVL